MLRVIQKRRILSGVKTFRVPWEHKSVKSVAETAWRKYFHLLCIYFVFIIAVYLLLLLLPATKLPLECSTGKHFLGNQVRFNVLLDRTKLHDSLADYYCCFCMFSLASIGYWLSVCCYLVATVVGRSDAVAVSICFIAACLPPHLAQIAIKK